ncbi:DinB family protein [Paenibacillus sp. P26]|nr:DinB family protein [Paenibacillus sp. P26]
MGSLRYGALTRKPSETEWSLGQMYMHLAGAALFMQPRNAEACREQALVSAPAASGKTEAGQAVFEGGGFPPIRIQVPASKQTTPPQPESKEQIRQGLKQVVQRMRELEPTLDSIPGAYTVEHPRLGGLNGKEWFVLVEMHYRHHLRQKERLDAFLNGTPIEQSAEQ